MEPFKDIAGITIRKNDLVLLTFYNRDSSLYLGTVRNITEKSVIINAQYGLTRISTSPQIELLIVNGNKSLLDKAKSLGLLSNQS